MRIFKLVSSKNNLGGLKCMAWMMVLLFFTVTLCIGGDVSTAMAKQKVWKIKMQLYTVPGKWDCQWAVPLKFTELVEKHTKGRVVFSVHPAGELVGPREIWTSVSAGTILSLIHI